MGQHWIRDPSQDVGAGLGRGMKLVEPPKLEGINLDCCGSISGTGEESERRGEDWHEDGCGYEQFLSCCCLGLGVLGVAAMVVRSWLESQGEEPSPSTTTSSALTTETPNNFIAFPVSKVLIGAGSSIVGLQLLICFYSCCCNRKRGDRPGPSTASTRLTDEEIEARQLSEIVVTPAYHAGSSI